ncbi:MAG: MinD/ParA family protein [Clostridium sp.]
MLDQAARLRSLVNNNNDTSEDKKAKIITVTSGKGGVGKSNFVVNLAIYLRKTGKRVLIFDADIGMGNDDVLMGIFPKYSIFDIIKGKSIDEVIIQGPEGVELLPGGSGLNRIEDMQEYERSMFLSKLQGLEGYDYILMDTGAGISRSVLAFLACSEELIVITTPEPTSLTDAYSLLKAADHFKIKDRAKVVVNRAFDKEEADITFKKFSNAVNRFLNINIEYLGCIYEDKYLVKGVREQKPFMISYPNSQGAKCIGEIGDKIIGDYVNSKAGAQGLFKKLFNLFS